MSELSPFHQELFSFLKRDALNRAEEEGYDIGQDRKLQKLHDRLDRQEGFALTEIIDDYQQIFSHRGPIHIENRWMNSFWEKEFKEVGLERYFPKIYRALPRLYHRDDPSRSRIKKNFTRLSDLRRLAVDRAVYSLYEGSVEPQKARIGIVTHVLPDGLGDWVAANETATLLAAKFPWLEIHLFAITTRELPKYNGSFQTHIVSKGETLLNDMDFLLQIPTRVPEEMVLRPRGEKIGEYGFLESEWFHPKSGNLSMGLHVLEKGIFTRKIAPSTFAEIEKKELLSILFGMETPGPTEIEVYKQGHHFHLAYLATPIGGAIYLHSLLKMRERDEKDIDLCSPDLGWLVGWMEGRSHILEQPFGVKEIQVLFNGGNHRLPVAEKGKVVRIISPGPLSVADMRRIVFLSDEWVAVRGNQSLSEAISAKKAFFYDGRDHARYLVKDLLALAENHLSGHRGALHAFRMMGQAFLWNLPDDLSDWVEESFFQEKLGMLHIATDLGLSLQDGDTLVGFKKISTLISEDHSFNPFACHLIERELFHRTNPSIRELEEKLMQLYATGQIPFSTLVKNLRTCIVPN